MSEDQQLSIRQPADLLVPSQFDHVMKVAKTYSESGLVPDAYKRNPANCLIALQMANRMGADALMVMQNLYIIYGRPSWSSSFMIAAANSCGRFTPLRFTKVGKPNDDSNGVFATAKAKIDGADLVGTTVTVGMARKQGWWGRKDSKWPDMTEQMLHYRAAAFWCRMYAPELLMGLPTQDEVHDIDPLPTDIQISTRKSEKGVAGMRNAIEAASDVEVKAEKPTAGHDGEDHTAAPDDDGVRADAKTEAPKEEKKPEGKPNILARCEIVAAEQRRAKRADGSVSDYCKVQLRGDKYTGLAYFDGTIDKLPGDGSVVDVVLVEEQHQGGPAYLINSIGVV